jgi:hypothetical protein
LSSFDNTAFNERLALAFGAGNLFHIMTKTGQLYQFSINILI